MRACATFASLALTLATRAWGQAPPAGPAPTAEQAAPAGPTPEQRLRRWKPKSYVPPVLDVEPATEPSDAPALSATGDALVYARPWWPSALVGGLAPGARVATGGTAAGRDARGCGAKRWYALGPNAWVCGGDVRSAEVADAAPYLPVREGTSLPWDYVMVKVPENESVPMYASREQMEASAEPERPLMRGDTVAVEKTVRVGDEPWWQAVDGRLLPVRGTFRLRERSTWQGVAVRADELPFGWITRDRTPVYDAPSAGRVAERLARRARVAILAESGEKKARRLRIGDGRWVLASDVNEVRREARPAAARAARWIDVDTGEQSLVLYEGDVPVYATLVSSGRAVATPLGDYPIWAKVATVTMKNPPYEDKPYFVHRVPWVLFFQAHNAIHGAYWHDRFGAPKSHGCLNASPRDARHLFEWVDPALPPGWTGVRPLNLLDSALVHVRNSARKTPFRQERPMGPPDPEEEKLKLEVAQERRAHGQGTPEVPITP